MKHDPKKKAPRNAKLYVGVDGFEPPTLPTFSRDAQNQLS